MYARLIEGALHVAPKRVEYDDMTVFNPPDSIYEELGYYPVVKTAMPNDAPTGYHYEPGWTQSEEAITQTCSLVENEVTSDDILNILFGNEVS